MTDIKDVLSRVTPARREVAICLDGSITSRLEDAEERRLAAVLYDAEHNQPSTARPIAEEITSLAAEAKEATTIFTVQSIGAGAWRRLVAEHPPPPDDRGDWLYDPSTFTPAAVAASCVDPEMDEDQATELAERLSNGQWGKLMSAVYAVNVGDDIPKFAPGTDGRRASEPSLTTAPPEESLTVSSSASEDSQRRAS